MQSTISKWGNSLALRLPRNVAEEARLVEGVTVNLEIEDGSLKITPSRKRFKLSELLANETQTAEMDWGQPKGEESW
jgi:antitoxin MazE